MKSIHEIRRVNLIRAITERCEDSQTKAAEMLDYSAPSLVSRYTRGAKNLGEKAARKIEKALGYPMRWLDTEHGLVGAAIERFEAPLDADSDELLSLVEALVPERRAALLRFLREFSGDMAPAVKRLGGKRTN